MLEHPSIGLYYVDMSLYSDNQIRADNQQGRPQVLEEPSETTRQTPRVTEAYLLEVLIQAVKLIHITFDSSLQPSRMKHLVP